jgi:hypothetical protein
MIAEGKLSNFLAGLKSGRSLRQSESEGKMMNIPQKLQNFMQYITEAFARIFGPNDDEYPKVGVQPFEGEPYREET